MTIFGKRHLTNVRVWSTVRRRIGLGEGKIEIVVYFSLGFEGAGLRTCALVVPRSESKTSGVGDIDWSLDGQLDRSGLMRERVKVGERC